MGKNGGKWAQRVSLKVHILGSWDKLLFGLDFILWSPILKPALNEKSLKAPSEPTPPGFVVLLFHNS